MNNAFYISLAGYAPDGRTLESHLFYSKHHVLYDFTIDETGKAIIILIDITDPMAETPNM